ncbi:MAG: hypothetical protein NZM42_02400 [Gemmatales bacterium]|nr:hypothetical protein [Gemmatales bacterium]MDW8222660.1 hypothetical protein [Gemmatales bacterium]
MLRQIGLVGCLVLPVMVLGQGKPNAVDNFLARQQIEAQRVEADIQTLLSQAGKVMASDPATAISLIQAAQRILEQDRALAPGRRTELRGLVAQRLREAENQLGQRASKPTAPPPPAQLKGNPADNLPLRQELDTIRRLIELREYSAATKLLADLEKRYPNHEQVQQLSAVLRRQTGMAVELREIRDLQREREVAASKVMRDLLAASTPITGDITYPPAEQWARINKRAEKYRDGMVPLTEKEKAILRSLSETIAEPINWEGVSLEKVLKDLEKLLGQPIVVDENELKDANVDLQIPISVRLPKGVTKRTVLRTVLARVGLEYVVKNEVIQVMTPARAAQQLVTRYYPIEDLLGVNGWFGAFSFTPLGQWLQAQNEAFQVAQLVQIIMTTVAPDSWRQPDGSGGPGTIVYDPVRKVLIIRNRAEVINALGGGLRQYP